MFTALSWFKRAPAIGQRRCRPRARACRRAPQGELLTYDIDHLDIFFGDPLERIITDQLEFMERI